MSHCELSSSSFVSYVYTVCLSYHCCSRTPVKGYNLAPPGGPEHHRCPWLYWLNVVNQYSNETRVSVFHYENLVPSLIANSHTLHCMVLFSDTCYSYVVWVKPILIRTWRTHIVICAIFSFTARCSYITSLHVNLNDGVSDSITVTVSNVSVWLKCCSSTYERVENREDAIKADRPIVWRFVTLVH